MMCWACSGETTVTGVGAEGEAETETVAPRFDLIEPACSALDTGKLGDGEIEIVVPSNARSFLISVLTSSVRAHGTSLTTPLGEEIPVRSDATDIESSLLWPQAQGTSIQPGTYALHIQTSALAPESFAVRCVAKVGPSSEGATLDVTHHFLNTETVSAKTAPVHAGLREVLAYFDAVLGLASISVRHSFEDLDAPDLIEIESVQGLSSELVQLLVQAPEGRALHVFWVADLPDGRGPEVMSISGGTPGPATFGGTGRSGVVVTTSRLDATDRWARSELALAAVHETLHFLGLFHTSGPNGENDPIADTPACTLKNDQNADGVLDIDECPDGANLMFWSPTLGLSTQLTAEQGALLRRSPLVF